MNDPAATGHATGSRFSIAPGPGPATLDDLRRVQHRDRLLRTELPRGREAATAWRNGLGALLTALIGFSLIKGRADVGQLAAVGATWNGPEKPKPALRVTTPAGVACGAVVRLTRGTVVPKTKAGEVTNDLTTAISVQPVDKCPEPATG
ncbi:hypothetical protein AB0M54_22945 [Actinoplanes sp. NPDC051470]|uniref:hypothetical protein n=1 Tax=Actinoplanes sp. NPDC051470 TaxID=3157224 RepID=UPI0034136414